MQMSFEWITPAPPFANNNSPKSAEAVAAATVKQPRPRNLFTAPSSLLIWVSRGGGREGGREAREWAQSGRLLFKALQLNRQWIFNIRRSERNWGRGKRKDKGWISLSKRPTWLCPHVKTFTHFFRVFAPFFGWFLKDVGGGENVRREWYAHQNRRQYFLVLTDSKILHLF